MGYFARLAARETEASAVSEISKKVLMTSTIREEHYITFPSPGWSGQRFCANGSVAS